jgi:hypothetical protein
MERKLITKLLIYFNNPFFRLFCLTFILSIAKYNYLLAICLSILFVFLMNQGLIENKFH